MSHEYRDLADHLGAPDGSFHLDLAVGESPRRAAREALSRAGVAVGAVAGRFAVLAPFTTRPQKHWFEDRWAALAGALRAEGLVPVLLGGPGDREAAARIAASAPTLFDLTGQLKLDETVAAIADAALLVGVDTGLTHMGTALGVPTVGLFGSTRPYLDAGTPRTAILYEPLDCSPCRRHPTCGGAYHCMRHWTVALVMAQVRRQLLLPQAGA